jgi:hypothetical protein
MAAAIEVRIYSAADPSELIDVLDRTRDRQWTDPIDELGVGSFAVSARHPKILAEPTLLEYGNVVRFHFRGEERFGFPIEKKTRALVSDGEDAGRWTVVSGRGVKSLLEGAVIYPAGGLGGGAEREWAAASAGQIMGDLLAEAIARGALRDVTFDFTDALDSSGAPFEVLLDLSERAGSDLLRVAMRHAELAVDVQMTPQLELRYFNSRGVDRTAGPAAVVLRPGQVASVGLEGEGVIKNTLLVEGPTGFSDRQHAGSAATYGRREGYLALANAKSADQINLAADRVLGEQATPADAISLEIVDGAGPQPYVDFDLGDYVLAPDDTGAMTAQRVMALTVHEDAEGRVTQVPELSARRLELELRIARWLKTIGEGALGGTAAAVSTPTADLATTAAAGAAVDEHEATVPHPDELADLADVDVAGVADGDALVFDDVAGKWVPGAPAAASLMAWHVPLADFVTWANMPAVVTELGGVSHWRTLVDLTDMTEVRLIVSVVTAGTAGALLRGQYSSDGGASWHDLAAAGEPEASLAAAVVASSNWQALAAGATEPVFLRVVGEGGDGAADPVVANVALQFR